MSNFLLFVLTLNAFLVGAAAAVAVRHALAHFRPHAHDAEKARQQEGVKLSPAVKAELLEKAKANFEKILEAAASQLQLDLSKTTAQLNKQLDSLGNEIVSDEMKRYKASLEELQKKTEVSITSTQDALNQHQDDLKAAMAEHQKEMLAKMNEEIAAEKDRLLAQIDNKLADAAASFLIETMQHDVDLGAQVPYLTKMIEEHKDDFKKEVGSESPAA
jgi:F0F1-type ATP synthase membrane subunit b/b'